MAQLDPDIILKATNQVAPPAAQLTAVANAQNDQAVAAQNQIKTQQMRQGQADDSALRQAVMGAGGDLQKALPQIMATNPIVGMKLQDTIRQQQSALMDYHSKQAEVSAQEAGSLKGLSVDQRVAAVPAAKQRLQALGIDPSGIPDPADPDFDAKVGAIQTRGLSAREQVAKLQKEQEDAIKVDEERRRQDADLEKARLANSPKLGSSGDFLTRYARDKGKAVGDLTGNETADALKQYSEATQKASALGGMNALYADVDPKAVAASIRRGEMPPDVANMSRPAAAAVMSELAKPGPNGERPFDLSSANREWKAQINLNRTMNGSQQVRLDESIKSGLAMYDKIDELADQWDSKGWGPLSRANMTAARNGALGERAASVANQLTGQIAQLTSDVATIEQGGLTPTNESRAVAEKSLQDWWSRGTIHDMTAQGRYNMQIRHLAQTQQEPKTPGNVGGMGDVTALPATPKAAVPEGRIHVIGPNGQKGTMPRGSLLLPGWKEG